MYILIYNLIFSAYLIFNKYIIQNDLENYIWNSYVVIIKLQIKKFKVLSHAIYWIYKLIAFKISINYNLKKFILYSVNFLKREKKILIYILFFFLNIVKRNYKNYKQEHRYRSSGSDCSGETWTHSGPIQRTCLERGLISTMRL